MLSIKRCATNIAGLLGGHTVPIFPKSYSIPNKDRCLFRLNTVALLFTLMGPGATWLSNKKGTRRKGGLCIRNDPHTDWKTNRHIFSSGFCYLFWMFADVAFWMSCFSSGTVARSSHISRYIVFLCCTFCPWCV